MLAAGRSPWPLVALVAAALVARKHRDGPAAGARGRGLGGLARRRGRLAFARELHAEEPETLWRQLLQRARGIAVVPNVFRGGFILGARRGRGVISLRMADGSWSNPAFVTLTGGSIGWQVGAESTDIVLIFANENAVRNIRSGKFTLGGEATAIAGPLRKQASSTMTFRAEVYGYLRSRGLYAGAAFQGARLKVNEDLAEALYAGYPGAEPFGPQSGSTPPAARRFLLALDEAVIGAAVQTVTEVEDTASAEAQTFPLPD